MYKKIIILVLLISPLFFIFIGYPIKNSKQKIIKDSLITKRCYQLGNTKEFFNCFKNHNRLSGLNLINTVVYEVNDLQMNMGYLLGFVTIVQVGSLFFLLRKNS